MAVSFRCPVVRAAMSRPAPVAQSLYYIQHMRSKSFSSYIFNIQSVLPQKPVITDTGIAHSMALKAPEHVRGIAFPGHEKAGALPDFLMHMQLGGY